MRFRIKSTKQLILIVLSSFQEKYIKHGNKKQVLLKTKSSHVIRWTLLVLWGLTIYGCAFQQPVNLVIPNEEQQNEIIRLNKLLADKDLEISGLRANQQHQVKELKETTNQIARAEVKLRRVATEADVASRLAEVEVAMKVLQSNLNTGHEMPLQSLAQSLLDKASDYFKRNEYSASADHAAHAEQLIGLLMDEKANVSSRVASETIFKTAIPLKIKADSQLRSKPHSKTTVLGKLQKATQIIARSYQGQWLNVQTEDGSAGWVSADFVEPR